MKVQGRKDNHQGSQLSELTSVLVFGSLAPLFFSIAFVINKVLSAQGAHWYWSASLRYFLVVPMLAFWVFHKFGWLAQKNLRNRDVSPVREYEARHYRAAYLRAGWHSLLTVWSLYRRRWKDWTIAGLTGCVGFYLPITYAQSQPGVPAWVVASTFVLTIPIGRSMHRFFGRAVPREVSLGSVWTVVLGVVIINLDKHGSTSLEGIVRNFFTYLAPAFLPVLLGAASFAYSHEIVAGLLHGRKKKVGKAIEPINHPHLQDESVRVLLMDVGSLPIWIICIPIIDHLSASGVAVNPVGLPSQNQILALLIVAFFSACVGRTFFTRARQRSSDPSLTSLAEVLLGLEIIYVLVLEHLVLAERLPRQVGIIGIAMVFAGLFFYIWSQRSYQAKKSDLSRH